MNANLEMFTMSSCMITWFIHFFRNEIQDFFKTFSRPYHLFSRLSISGVPTATTKKLSFLHDDQLSVASRCQKGGSQPPPEFLKILNTNGANLGHPEANLAYSLYGKNYTIQVNIYRENIFQTHNKKSRPHVFFSRFQCLTGSDCMSVLCVSLLSIYLFVCL